MKIPISYVSRPGYEDVPEAFKSPVIEILIGYDPNGNLDDNNPLNPAYFRPVRVLIDTGADDLVIDRDLIAGINAPRLVDTGSISTIHGVSEFAKHEVHMMIPELGFKSSMDVVALPIDNRIRAYQGIFGLRFLEKGRLIIDPMGESSFTFHGF
ncbi:retroviral-like aspartic protease family protein [Rhizobium leguminosarum]|uniref:retroviral-like aspartic protease family protein n=1 Tax=Rhizobium leguminosarum TaxID=384 RepID=UPI003F9C1A94